MVVLVVVVVVVVYVSVCFCGFLAWSRALLWEGGREEEEDKKTSTRLVSVCVWVCGVV